MKFTTSVELEEEQIARLDRLADRMGLRERAPVLRRVIDKGLKVMEQVQDEMEQLEAVHVAIVAKRGA